MHSYSWHIILHIKIRKKSLAISTKILIWNNHEYDSVCYFFFGNQIELFIMKCLLFILFNKSRKILDIPLLDITLLDIIPLKVYLFLSLLEKVKLFSFISWQEGQIYGDIPLSLYEWPSAFGTHVHVFKMRGIEHCFFLSTEKEKSCMHACSECRRRSWMLF